MQVRVLYFAHAARLSGIGEERLEVEPSATLGTVQRLLFDARPGLLPLRESLRWAIDEQFASEDAPLRDGCTIAALPPFSGG